MNLVLALEPDAAQANPLTSLIRRKLGANLTIVTTAEAAIVAMNQRLPDVLLFGRDVPRTEREEATAHLTSLSGAAGVRTLEIAKLTDPGAEEKAAFEIRMCLAAAEEERVRAMATMLASSDTEPEWAAWNEFASETAVPHGASGPAPDSSPVEAEVDRRVKSEVERLRRDADARIANEFRRARQDAAAARAVQQERIEAPAVHAAGSVRWRIAAIAAVVTFVIGIGVLWLPHAVSTAARNSTALVGTAQNAAKVVAQQAVAAAPVVTRQALDAAERALPHVDIVKAPAAMSPTSAGTGEKPAPLTGPGFITAFSRIPMDVYADGKRIGSTEDGQLLLANGTHQIEFVSERFHYRAVAALTIPAGHVLPYTVALPSADVRVTTTPGAEIWIEGERVGVAPMEPVAVLIGTREIVVRDSYGAEKRQTVEVKYGGTTEVSLTPEAVAGDESSPATPRLAPLTR